MNTDPPDPCSFVKIRGRPLGYAFCLALVLSLYFTLQHEPLASWFFLSCFASCFMSHEPLLQQHESFEQQPSAPAAPSLSIGHEPSLQQHDSIAQQASAFFFWSPSAGVCAIPTANATSSNPRSRIKIVFLRGFISILLFKKI